MRGGNRREACGQFGAETLDKGLGGGLGAALALSVKERG